MEWMSERERESKRPEREANVRSHRKNRHRQSHSQTHAITCTKKRIINVCLITCPGTREAPLPFFFLLIYDRQSFTDFPFAQIKRDLLSIMPEQTENVGVHCFWQLIVSDYFLCLSSSLFAMHSHILWLFFFFFRHKMARFYTKMSIDEFKRFNDISKFVKPIPCVLCVKQYPNGFWGIKRDNDSSIAKKKASAVFINREITTSHRIQWNFSEILEISLYSCIIFAPDYWACVFLSMFCCLY